MSSATTTTMSGRRRARLAENGSGFRLGGHVLGVGAVRGIVPVAAAAGESRDEREEDRVGDA